MTNGEDAMLLSRNNWRSVAVAVIVVFVCTLGGGLVSYARFNIAQAATVKEVSSEQIDAREQRIMLTEAVIGIKELNEKQGDSITAIEKELRYNRCMDEKRSVKACVPILLQ